MRAARAIGAVVFAVALAPLADCAAGPVPPDGASRGGAAAAPEAAAPSAPDTCPARLRAPELLPRVRAEHVTLAHWLARWEPLGLDEPVLRADEIASLNAANAERGVGRFDVAAPLDAAALAAEVDERLAYMRERVDAGTYRTTAGEAVPVALRALLDARAVPDTGGELREVTAPLQVYCAPFADGLFTAPIDPRIDRNRCSTLRPGERMRVADANGPMWLVRAGYTMGWVVADAASAATTTAAAPTADAAATPLTRRAFLTALFDLVGTPYGWGGTDGGRDCSRTVMDVFEAHGVELPRFSGSQARAGSFSIDVSGVTREADKLRIFDAALRRGLVTLHFPGHVMVYLGRDADGTPMVLHSFAEYLAPCDEPEEGGDRDTLFEVDRVTVNDLELGRGSERRAFIERITTVTVIGRSPGLELDGVAEVRPAAATGPGAGAQCAGDENAFLIVSPRAPNAEQPLRVVVTATEDFGPVEIAFTDPDGNRHVPPLRRLGGPPYAAIAQVDAPAAGTWTIAMGDGARIIECETVSVARRRPAAATGSGPVWPNRRTWNRHYENLYATFIESLFAYPIEEDLTWSRMHELTRNPALNVLFDHLGEREDERLRLEPDCADLPYMLRAYFAWKMGLPFGFRACSRGRAGRPPTCGDLRTNLMDRAAAGDVDAFQRFASRDLRNGVHSGTGRTAPTDDDTDFYPVALTRDALLPGTLYADPYGHLLIVAGWVPQGLDGYGVLIGADSQPDATVGRRRFWRGSFLFTPDTTDVGAGFKAFRPFRVRDGVPVGYTNAELVNDANFAPYSMQQHEVTEDGFYATIEAVASPRPVDADAVLASLVEALFESASRRVNSVDNGEAYMRASGFRAVDMPTGYAIFETIGPWEDYATPSRDMRLLISIDTVVNFPERVAAHPAQYGVDPERVGEAVAAVRTQLDAALATRRFAYTRTDGSTWELSLADLVERAPRFEVAYNPNDCPELRWGAPDGSDEASTCRRRAPAAQVERMASYRDWFIARARPPR